ncbi:MAG: hypothetical protein U5K72_11980 [Balneolaceae bacterium]|nr:hypothetical protein [Balneolaceae bacterium]
MYKQIIGCLILFMLMFLQITVSVAQDGKSREGAFIRSLVVPGWGHYYVNQEKWRRGQVHLGAEIALIASYFGFSTRAKNLENQYETLALLKAGVSISDRSRSFQLAMGDFNTLREYNEYQLRSRNWNRLYEDQTENRWNWKTTEDRNKYNDLRSDVDRVENQLPAILGLMVVNRVISALSAYNRAKTQLNVPEMTLMPVMIDEKKVGVTARLTLNF